MLGETHIFVIQAEKMKVGEGAFLSTLSFGRKRTFAMENKNIGFGYSDHLKPIPAAFRRSKTAKLEREAHWAPPVDEPSSTKLEKDGQQRLTT